MNGVHLHVRASAERQHAFGDLHDDLDAVPKQASFINDAELEALPESFLDPDSDVGDYDDSNFEDKCSAVRMSKA